MLAKRGVIEEFSGPPWRWAERHEMLGLPAIQGFTASLDVPEDDPVHRRRRFDPRFGPLIERTLILHPVAAVLHGPDVHGAEPAPLDTALVGA